MANREQVHETRRGQHQHVHLHGLSAAHVGLGGAFCGLARSVLCRIAFIRCLRIAATTTYGAY